MRVESFRFLTTSDLGSFAVDNWSRVYEYSTVLKKISEDPSIKTIHNTCCGFSPLHASFGNKLKEFGTVYNSDIYPTKVFDNFFIYDILMPYTMKADCVISISAIEDFLREDLTIRAINNLIEQTNKHLFITADIYDRVDANWFKKAVGLPLDYGLDTTNALCGSNSSRPQFEFSHIKILFIHLIK